MIEQRHSNCAVRQCVQQEKVKTRIFYYLKKCDTEVSPIQWPIPSFDDDDEIALVTLQYEASSYSVLLKCKIALTFLPSIPGAITCSPRWPHAHFNRTGNPALKCEVRVRELKNVGFCTYAYTVQCNLASKPALKCDVRKLWYPDVYFLSLILWNTGSGFSNCFNDILAAENHRKLGIQDPQTYFIKIFNQTLVCWFLQLLFLRQLFYPLLGRTRSRDRCWSAIGLSHRPQPSGRAVHEEVDGLDIGWQHGRRFILLRHTRRPQRRPYPICTSRSGNAQHRCGATCPPSNERPVQRYSEVFRLRAKAQGFVSSAQRWKQAGWFIPISSCYSIEMTR